jgi:hypothetical protein
MDRSRKKELLSLTTGNGQRSNSDSATAATTALFLTMPRDA